MGKAIDITGQVFGELKAIRFSGRNALRQTTWECECTCGNKVIVSSCHLRYGHTRPCGCLRIKTTINRSFRHGKARRGRAATEYRSWQAMIKRCCDSDNPKYKDYGGREITVCERWRNSFKEFLKDMGEPSETANTIERIDVNGNYEPSNCRWATPDEQARNKRSNIRLTINGQTLCVAEWSRKLGIPDTRIRGRLRLGWSSEQALDARNYRPRA